MSKLQFRPHHFLCAVGFQLEVKAGHSLSWGTAKQRIKPQISVEKFLTICASCSWKALGVCEQALIALKSNH